jgi:tripartite-type tricarboxylate transporter receptor subunit TctC
VGAAIGQPMMFESRPGASGTIDSDIVARSPRDGYTLLFTTGSHTSNAVYLKKLPYDPIADFLPVSQVARAFGQVLVVHPAMPVKSVKDLIALAKARKERLNYASTGVGNATHIAGELFMAGAGISLVHVTYKGGGPALTDVLGGHVEIMFPSVTQALPHIQAGRLRPLPGGQSPPGLAPSFSAAQSAIQSTISGVLSAPQCSAAPSASRKIFSSRPGLLMAAS